MCKLCNTHKPIRVFRSRVNPKKSRYRKYKSSFSLKTEKALTVVFDYIKDFPCSTCYIAMLNHMNNTTTALTLDEWVQQRLLYKYVNTKEKKRIADLRYKKLMYTKLTRVESSIFLKEKTSTFIVKFSRTNLNTSRNFKTLEEAQQYKQRILNDK